MLITEIRQCLWWSDQLHEEWGENQGACLSFHPRMRENSHMEYDLKGLQEAKAVVLWSVTIHDSHYFGGGGRISDGKTRSWALKCKFEQDALFQAWRGTNGFLHP